MGKGKGNTDVLYRERRRERAKNNLEQGRMMENRHGGRDQRELERNKGGQTRRTKGKIGGNQEKKHTNTYRQREREGGTHECEYTQEIKAGAAAALDYTRFLP